MDQLVTEIVLTVLNASEVPNDLNHNFITMIPKKKHVVKVGDFGPISCCNMVYKLVLKVIANRLKLVIPHVISISQCAFVPGRQVTDNVLVADELVHFLRRKIWGKKGYMSIKFNMSKVYD